MRMGSVRLLLGGLIIVMTATCSSRRDRWTEPAVDESATAVPTTMSSEQPNSDHTEPPNASDEFGLAAAHTRPAHNIALARQEQREQLFEWLPWSREVFDKARSEGRYILLHCAAVWCHWCHVMEETTYLDPDIGRILRDRFVTVRVDIDARPDISERYEDWGWPATVLFTPEAEEVGKYRGYLSADELRNALESVGERSTLDDERDRYPGPHSAPRAAVPWIARHVTMNLDEYFDPELGGWGFRQKAPIGDNAYFEALRAERGVPGARERLLTSLRGHAQLIDPVWGGIYQYSTGRSWQNAHFEKLMTYQAANLSGFARGYRALREPSLLDSAERIAAYVDRFLTSERGTFYVTQDADVGTHDRSQRFVDGNVYYARDEPGRLALGIPWVDTHVYAYENGLMIVALDDLYEASQNSLYLARAQRAADALIDSHIQPDGAVRHDADSAQTVRFLADAAGLGWALARLATRVQPPDERERYLRAAERVAVAMNDTLWDSRTRAYFAHTEDERAAGVFTRRRHPFGYNILAARFLAALTDAGGDPSLRERGRDMLAAIATPQALSTQGRMIGGFLSALHESGLYPWSGDNTAQSAP